MSLGGLKSKEDFERIFSEIENKLGRERANSFHAHYSRIEYTNAGEKKHHTFAESEFEPDFDFIGEIMAEKQSSQRIICESAGTMAEDALAMKKAWLSMIGE